MIGKILRFLPAFRGKQRLARFLLKGETFHLTDVLIKGKYNCRYKVPNIKDSIGFELYVNGIYEEEIIEFIKSHIPENGNFLDIGANIGAITIPLMTLRKDIKSICIEAAAKVYTSLSFNIANNNLLNCLLLNRAVTDTDEEIVTFYSPEDQFGKGSLSNAFTQKGESVKTMRLDTLTKNHCKTKIDFIKIDIEGYEYYAFKGARQLLTSKDAPDILFEFVDWAEDMAKELSPGLAQKLLMEYGYNLYIVAKNGSVSPLLTPLTKGSAMIFATKN